MFLLFCRLWNQFVKAFQLAGLEEVPSEILNKLKPTKLVGHRMFWDSRNIYSVSPAGNCNTWIYTGDFTEEGVEKLLPTTEMQKEGVKILGIAAKNKNPEDNGFWTTTYEPSLPLIGGLRSVEGAIPLHNVDCHRMQELAVGYERSNNSELGTVDDMNALFWRLLEDGHVTLNTLFDDSRTLMGEVTDSSKGKPKLQRTGGNFLCGLSNLGGNTLKLVRSRVYPDVCEEGYYIRVFETSYHYKNPPNLPFAIGYQWKVITLKPHKYPVVPFIVLRG